MRNIDDAHGAWDHRITPERRGQLAARPPRYTRHHAARRAVFLLVLLALALVMWRLLAAGGVHAVVRSGGELLRSINGSGGGSGNVSGPQVSDVSPPTSGGVSVGGDEL